MNVIDCGEYGDIFKERGYLYHLAMERYPNAREREFKNLFESPACPVRYGESILDIPSLGGYLDLFVGEIVDIKYADFAASKNVINLESPYSDWGVGIFDRIISLASTHHIKNIEKFISNIDNHLKIGGTVTIADVESDSGVSKFLDEYVDKYTITGSHKGFYYNFSEIQTPWKTIGNVKKKCDWKFETLDGMVCFCSLLFGLVNFSSEDLLKSLDKNIGILSIENGFVLQWELVYNHYVKI